MKKLLVLAQALGRGDPLSAESQGSSGTRERTGDKAPFGGERGQLGSMIWRHLGKLRWAVHPL